MHRSGRTGRAGAEGMVISLVGAEERHDVHKLQRELNLPQGLHAIELGVLDGAALAAPRHDERMPTPAGGGRARKGPTSRDGWPRPRHQPAPRPTPLIGTEWS